MSSRYIVGYDGSDAAGQAFRFVRRLADAAGATVVAAHVYPGVSLVYSVPYTPAVPPGAGRDLDAAARSAAESLLDELGSGIERRAIVGGSVPAELQSLARTEAASLMAVGVTHRGAVGRLLPGSVGERLVHGSPCPVLVVPEGAADRPLTTIGVAFDGRGESRRALRTAEALAANAGAALRLIGAVDPGFESLHLLQPSHHVDKEHGSRVAATLERAAAGVRQRGIDATTEVVLNPAGPGIARDAADLDLLVCGSRGYGPLRSVMLGGVSRYLLDHAPCPVMVVPRTATLSPVTEEDALAGASTP